MDESTTTTTTVDQSPTTTTTTESTTVAPDIQTQENVESKPMDEVESTTTTTTVDATAANDQTTNDVAQTSEERFAQARSDAMTNHAAEHGTGAGEQSNTEEQV